MLAVKFDNTMAARASAAASETSQNESFTNAQSAHTSDFNSAEEMVDYGLSPPDLHRSRLGAAPR